MVLLMSTNEIIAQIIGVVLILTTILTPHPKTRHGMLLVILVANILACTQFYFVDAKTGLFGLIVTATRSVVYWGFSLKNKKAPLVVFVFFLVAQTASTFLGWDDWFSILTLSLLFNTYGQWQKDDKILRICLIINAALLGFYCIHAHAYTGAVNKFLQSISAIIALYRMRRKSTG